MRHTEREERTKAEGILFSDWTGGWVKLQDYYENGLSVISLPSPIHRQIINKDIIHSYNAQWG